MIGLAILTRPAGLYLPVVLALGWLVRGVALRATRPLAHAGILLVIPILCIAPWVARNAYEFGITRLTTADPINLVYFSGAGAYAVEHRVPLTEAQELIRQEYGLTSLVDCNNFWNADRPVRQIDAELRAAAPRILRKYPRSLAVSTGQGIGKVLVSHNAGSLAAMARTGWQGFGIAAALRGDWAAFKFTANSPVLIGVFFQEVALAVAVLVLAVAGVWVGLRSGPLRWPTAGLLLVAGYYLLTIGVVGLDAYTRHRSTLTPILALLAGAALARFFRPDRPVAVSPAV